MILNRYLTKILIVKLSYGTKKPTNIDRHSCSLWNDNNGYGPFYFLAFSSVFPSSRTVNIPPTKKY